MEEKIKKLSNTIVNYSLKIKENDRVLITSVTSKPKKLIESLIDDITKKGAIVFVEIKEPSVENKLLKNTNNKRINQIVLIENQKVENFDAFIQIRYTTNEYENSNVDSKIIKEKSNATKDIDFIRINKRRWVLLNYPSDLDAYKAKKNTEEFEDFAFNAMNYDYINMKKDMEPLVKLMEKTDMVHIIGPNTDLTFSIKGMPIIPCCGECNIPDGEVYTAPIKDSVNGMIKFNTPSVYRDNVYNDIYLKFENGKIIDAKSTNDSDKLNEIFDTDTGSRYIGEFSFGLNPLITDPMGDILFDEKIIGSIHLTPGQAYQDAYNGNDSTIHWDLVMIGTKKYGGSEIYFDDVLIRKDGIFVLPELKNLNYLSK